MTRDRKLRAKHPEPSAASRGPPVFRGSVWKITGKPEIITKVWLVISISEFHSVFCPSAHTAKSLSRLWLVGPPISQALVETTRQLSGHCYFFLVERLFRFYKRKTDRGLHEYLLPLTRLQKWTKCHDWQKLQMQSITDVFPRYDNAFDIYYSWTMILNLCV